MPRIPYRPTMRPPISTMPRNTTEAGEQLELYKMVAQRQRIVQELQSMERRIQMLQEQLGLLDSQIENSEKKIQDLRQSSPHFLPIAPANPQKSATQKNAGESNGKSGHFQTFYLDC